MRKASVVLFALVVILYAASSAARALDSDKPTKSIATDGSARVWIAPDRARLFLGVETLAETLEEARQENAATMNRIMEGLRSLKIEDLYVQSPTYKVGFVKEDELAARKQLRLPKILGYRVTQKFTVLLKNDDITSLSQNAGLVLDTALQSGVNIITQDVMFFKEDLSQEKEEALRLALEDAMARAEVIAETAGLTIEAYSRISSAFQMGSDYDRYGPVSQVSSPMPSQGEASTLVAAEIPIKASVSLGCIVE